MGFLGDVFLENFGLGGLRVAKIHHFVEEFVDDDEVVADGFFFEGFEVFGEGLDEAVEEEEEGCWVGVAFCEGEEVEVGMADVEVLVCRCISLVFCRCGFETGQWVGDRGTG